MGNRRYPWGNFPDVVRNGDLGELKREPEYLVAKAGDAAAALNLADRLIRPEFVASVGLLAAQHPHPVLLPVLAEESAGNNRIPLMFAQVLEHRLHWMTETGILQVTRSWRTDSGADHRLVVQPEFDGPVDPEAGYILLDDTLTMGGTLASLRGYIQSQGGQVLGAAVGVAHVGALRLPIQPAMLESIFTKHGKEAVQAFAQEEWGYGIECLTQAEAGHVRKALSLDALRDRFTQARDASIQQLGERGVAPSLSGYGKPATHELRASETETLTLPNLSVPNERHAPPPEMDSGGGFVHLEPSGSVRKINALISARRTTMENTTTPLSGAAAGDDAIHQQISQSNNKLDMFAARMESFNNQPEIKAARENAAKYGMEPHAAIHQAMDQNPALKEQFLGLHKMFHEHVEPALDKHAMLVSQLKDPQQQTDAIHYLQARSNRMTDAQKDWPERNKVMSTENTASNPDNAGKAQKTHSIGEILSRIMQKLHDMVFGKSKPGATNKDAAENTAQAQTQQQGKTDQAMQTAKTVAGVATAIAAPEVAIAAQVANLAKDQVQPAQKPSVRPKR